MLAQHWVIALYLLGALKGSIFTDTNIGFTRDMRLKKWQALPEGRQPLYYEDQKTDNYIIAKEKEKNM